MMFEEYGYFLVLTAVVVLSVATLYLNFKFTQRSLFDKVMASFLLFLISHSIYACVARYVYGDAPFVDIGAPFNLLYAPFFYTSLIALKKTKDWKLKRIVVHLIPAILFWVLFWILLINQTLYTEYSTTYLIVLYSTAGVQFISYALFGFVKFNNNIGAKELKLVTNYAIKLMVLVALIFLSLVFDKGLSNDATNGSGVVVYLFMLLIAMVVFRYHVIIILKLNRFVKVDASLEVKVVKQVVIADKVDAIKYVKSRINNEEGLVYLSRLNKAMDEDKLYLDSELTIDSLSKKLKMTKHHLTQVFTMVLDTNFNQHINHYRVIHASILLKDFVRNASIGDIGNESGFNSRTSFYRVFKTHFGVSPADYKKLQKHSKKK